MTRFEELEDGSIVSKYGREDETKQCGRDNDVDARRPSPTHEPKPLPAEEPLSHGQLPSSRLVIRPVPEHLDMNTETMALVKSLGECRRGR